MRHAFVRIYALALLVATGSILAACGGASAPSSSGGAGAAQPTPTAPEPLATAYSNVSCDFLSAWIAQESGIYAQNGLQVDQQLISGGSKTLAGLLSGQVQIGMLGGAEVLSASASGADLVILGTLAPVYPYLFEVTADIKTIDDLRGKKVGVSNPGSSSDIAARVSLRRQGLDPDKDVTLVPVDSHANRSAALISGAIQGGVDDPPDTAELEKHGVHPLFDLADLKLPAANTVIVVQRAWLEGHRETTQRFVDAIVQAIARAKQDKPFAVGVIKKYFKLQEDAPAVTAYDFFMREVTPSRPFPKPEQFSDALAILGEKNEKLRGFDVSKILEPALVQSAVDRGLAAPE